MKRANYLPGDKAGKELWLKNFSAKLSKYATKYGIPTAEVSELQQATTYVVYINDYVQQYSDYLKDLIEVQKEVHHGNKNNNAPSVPPTPPSFATVPPTVAPAVFDRAISIGNRILEHTKYAPADGMDLSIEVTPKAKKIINVDLMKPILQTKLIEGGRPQIVWKKNGMDALEIWVDRNNNNNFVLSDVDIKPNYTDNFPLPEDAALWRYKAIYRKDNQQVGQWSDIISIAVVKL